MASLVNSIIQLVNQFQNHSNSQAAILESLVSGNPASADQYSLSIPAIDKILNIYYGSSPYAEILNADGTLSVKQNFSSTDDILDVSLPGYGYISDMVGDVASEVNLYNALGDITQLYETTTRVSVSNICSVLNQYDLEGYNSDMSALKSMVVTRASEFVSSADWLQMVNSMFSTIKGAAEDDSLVLPDTAVFKVQSLTAMIFNTITSILTTIIGAVLTIVNKVLGFIIMAFGQVINAAANLLSTDIDIDAECYNMCYDAPIFSKKTTSFWSGAGFSDGVCQFGRPGAQTWIWPWDDNGVKRCNIATFLCANVQPYKLANYLTNSCNLNEHSVDRVAVSSGYWYYNNLNMDNEADGLQIEFEPSDALTDAVSNTDFENIYSLSLTHPEGILCWTLFTYLMCRLAYHSSGNFYGTYYVRYANVALSNWPLSDKVAWFMFQMLSHICYKYNARSSAFTAADNSSLCSDLTHVTPGSAVKSLYDVALSIWEDLQANPLETTTYYTLTYDTLHTLGTSTEIWYTPNPLTNAFNVEYGAFWPPVDRKWQSSGYPMSFTFKTPNVSNEKKRNFLLASAAIVIATASIAIVVGKKLKKWSFKKMSERSRDLNAARDAYNKGQISFDQYYKESRSYNLRAKLFGWSTYDYANGWFNDPGSSAAPTDNTISTANISNSLNAVKKLIDGS